MYTFKGTTVRACITPTHNERRMPPQKKQHMIYAVTPQVVFQLAPLYEPVASFNAS